MLERLTALPKINCRSMTASRSKGSCTDPAHRKHSEKLFFCIAAAPPDLLRQAKVARLPAIPLADCRNSLHGIAVGRSAGADHPRPRARPTGLSSNRGRALWG